MEIHVSVSSASNRQLLEAIARSGVRIEQQLHRMESRMTDLDQAVADIQAAVDRIATDVGPVVTALRADLQAAQDALAVDDATISADVEAAAAALAHAGENADKLEGMVGQLSTVTTT